MVHHTQISHTHTLHTRSESITRSRGVFISVRILLLSASLVFAGRDVRGENNMPALRSSSSASCESLDELSTGFVHYVSFIDLYSQSPYFLEIT